MSNPTLQPKKTADTSQSSAGLLQSIVELVSIKKDVAHIKQAMQMMVDFVQNLKKTNETEFTLMQSAFQMLKSKVEADAKTETGNIKQEVSASMSAQLHTIESKLASLEAKQSLLKDGDDGISPDPEELVTTVLSRLPAAPAPIEPAEPYNDQVLLERMQTLEQELTSIKNALVSSSKGRTVGNMASSTAGWGAHPLVVQQSGSTKVKVARVINFTGATVTHSRDGITTVAVSAGSASFQQPSSGVINGSNQVFVWATAPNVIIVDGGRAMQKSSSDGTVNWTGTTTVTLTIAPTFDIFSTN